MHGRTAWEETQHEKIWALCTLTSGSLGPTDILISQACISQSTMLEWKVRQGLPLIS